MIFLTQQVNILIERSGLLSFARLMYSGCAYMGSLYIENDTRVWTSIPGFFMEDIMELNFVFFLNSIMLGVGLAMDAFSVSLANGMNESGMRQGKMWGIAGVFGIFQGLMPLIGWVCIHTIVQFFQAFETLIPWIALGLLSYIGGKMLLDGLHPGGEEEINPGVGFAALMVQGIATSIDALSVGFTIAEYDLGAAVLAAAIIALVTVMICYFGLIIGKKAGTRLAGKAGVFGGVILILIGIEIFITSFF